MGDTRFDAVIVGAGFAGLYMLHRLRKAGLNCRVYEAGSGVGGTWYWNRYPGARCDVESVEYSYSFSEELESEWRWSERYAPQAEILRYLNHAAERFDLLKDIEFETRVEQAVFDADGGEWGIVTDRGGRVTALFCIMATGCLSTAKVPEYPGLDRFQGSWYHTGHWPAEGVDFTGKRVAVIGTGSSGIQSIPIIAEQASQLHVFQRTPNFSLPAHNGPLEEETREKWHAARHARREEARNSVFAILSVDGNERSALEAPPEEREATYEERWRRGGFAVVGAYVDLVTNKEANDTAAEFVREKIRATVKDPRTAEKLIPRDYPLGTKRICVDTNYYATFNRENVTLVDVRETPIEAITAQGIRTSDGDYEVDCLVFATGFDAMTGALMAIDIRGREGVSLKEKWADGPRTYLGLMVAGFPNLFTITGPGSPSVLSNMVVSIEQHVEWIGECLEYLRSHGMESIEADGEAEDAWVSHVSEVADHTLFPLANSWYVGANVPGKPRVFMPYIGGVGAYRQKCAEIAAENYKGFRLRGAAAHSTAH